MENKYLNNNDPKKVFKIPEDYFANLENRVLSAIENTPSTPKIVPLYKKKYVWVAVAASLSLLLGISILFKTENNNRVNNDNLENYLEYNLTYSQNNDIINALDDEDIKELEQNIEIKQSQLDHYVLSHIDIEYYLNE